MFVKLLIVYFLIITKTSLCTTLPSPEFEVTYDTHRLRITNLDLTNSIYLKLATLNVSGEIFHELTITDSKVPIWPVELCNSFPNLVTIIAEDIGLEKLPARSLDNCTKIGNSSHGL